MSSRVIPLRAAVRPARFDDRDFLVSLSERVFSSYARDPSVAMVRMMRNARGAGGILIAEEQLTHKRPVKRELRLGFAVVVLEELGRAFGPWERPSVAHLDAIAVRPEMGGRGVGHLILKHAEDLAREQGAVSMSLLTAETNENARRLFRGAGYQTILPIDDSYIDGQRGLSMMKPLSDRSR